MPETELLLIECRNCDKPLARVRPKITTAAAYEEAQAAIRQCVDFYCEECYNRIRSTKAPHWPA
jgi:hypothetical protein